MGYSPRSHKGWDTAERLPGFFHVRFLKYKRMKVKSLSLVRVFVTTWTVARQAPLSIGFSRQEHWSGLPFPSPGDLPDPGFEPGPPALQADALPSEPLHRKMYKA